MKSNSKEYLSLCKIAKESCDFDVWLKAKGKYLVFVHFHSTLKTGQPVTIRKHLYFLVWTLLVCYRYISSFYRHDFEIFLYER